MSNIDIHERSTIFVLFGAMGDLSCRLIIPALFNLYLDGQLPGRFQLIGVDRQDCSGDSLAGLYRKCVSEHSRNGAPDNEKWLEFSKMIRYAQADLTDESGYARLKELLSVTEKQWQIKAEYVFYMATPPFLFTSITQGLGSAGLSRDSEKARLVVEKPIGYDLESSREINSAISRVFVERQIFRIDHFLGKETVQNILAMRFANPMFEPVWNRRYIDHIAITVAETLGVEHRSVYYERAGALRDMVQNHMLQLLCLVAMEPPVSYDTDDIRNKKMDVLHALRPISKDKVNEFTARGQYGAGWINGVKVPAYREEPGVAPRSHTETYTAMKLFVDNWRWQGVPFYLRTGKRMTSDVSEISVRFRDVPHQAFPASAGLNAQPARIVIQIQPEQGIVLKFMAKEPGTLLRLRPVNMRFSYKEAFKISSPAAYETLLWDVMTGDTTLFMRNDQVEAAWRLMMPVLEVWADNPATDFPNYAAGLWGPESAELLVAHDGNSWMTPTI